MKIYHLLFSVILLFGCKVPQISETLKFLDISTISQLVLVKEAPSSGLSINELEVIIIEAEKQGNVSARSHIHQYWQLADLYIINEEYQKAYEIIIRGLRLDSWNYKYQKIAAEIELMNKEYEKAYNRLNFIINNLSELGNIYYDSLLQIQNIDIENMDNEPLNIPGYYLYIATYPNLYSSVVDIIASRISEEFGIEIRIINIGLDESEVNMRDRQLVVINEIIDNILLSNPRSNIDNFLQQIGLSNEAFNTPEGKRRFIYALYNQTENGRNDWAELELIKSQYSGNALLGQLSQRLRNYINDPYCLGVLGVTSKDIFENDFNFLFGWAQRKVGVLSYSRFLLDNPTIEQFEKRTIMQAFSSVGIIIGIPRCTSPNCARAYPNSLEEQDRKDDKICNECRGNLLRIYRTLR